MDAVIVTYNSEIAVNALLLNERIEKTFDRVIVVDNASTDATCALCREFGASVYSLPSNLGFGSAANFGASKTTTDVFALLNPDIVFVNPYAPASLEIHFYDPEVAVVGPRLVLPNGRTQDSARQIPSIADLVLRRLTGTDEGEIHPSAVQDVPWVVGGCMIIRKSAFESIGGFDPRYFLYFEDVDLCVRFGSENWKIRFDPNVVALHSHAAESREGLLTVAARRHMRSAARFYAEHPRFASRRGDLMRIGRRVIGSRSSACSRASN